MPNEPGVADPRIEATEQIVSTLAKKAGLIESQMQREQLPPPENQTIRLAQQTQVDAVSAHIRRILSLAK